MEEPTYYSVIPAEVRYDKKLTHFEKLLFGEITALTSATGECWAKNEYFEKLYSASERAVSRSINKLVKYGYLTSDIESKKLSGNITKKRVLKMSKGYSQKCQKGIAKNGELNNTSINKYIYDESSFSESTRKIAEMMNVTPTKGLESYITKVYPNHAFAKMTIRMLNWCEEKGVAPTTMRWIKWADREYKNGTLEKKVRE